ncbi:MAG: V-type ATPase subunit [Treponema sp.]|jgi:vacuolar-type H+-ATPase subunit C/Vma6|nr:V-type ATPase subunit [Treponema sp.]
MLDAGGRAYAYSKACGIIGKSFVGKRIPALYGLHTLSEFSRFVFPHENLNLPGRELLADLERRIIARTIRQIVSVINSYQKPPELLILLLRSYEYSDLKSCLHYIDAGKKEQPVLCDIGDYKTIHFEAYPDIAAMLAATEFENIPGKTEQKINFSLLESEIDKLYYRRLKETLFSLSSDDREISQRIIAEEIAIRNCIWAFRLRTYFHKTAEETKDFLMDITMKSVRDTLMDSPRREISLVSDALKSLDFHLDIRSHWTDWKWEKLLNPEQPGVHWYADPKYFQNAASKYLYRLAMRYFRLMPMSVSMVFCFVKVKQYEEDLLTSIIEGLGLGMSSNDVLDLLGVS